MKMKEVQTPNKELFSKSLLALASSDIESSRILFLNGIHHNALFFLQQSIEKLVKAIGLDLNIIGTEKMGKISHSPHKIYKAAVDQTTANLVELDQAPEIKEIITSQDGFVDYENILKSTSTFFNEQYKYDFEYLDEEELSELIASLEHISLNSNNVEIDSDKYTSLLYKLFSTLPSWNSTGIDKEELNKNIKSALEIDLDLCSINQILLWLSLITQKHQDAVRYPCKCCGESPLINYCPETPIIKYFVNLFNLQMHCLTKYSELILRFRELVPIFQEDELPIASLPSTD